VTDLPEGAVPIGAITITYWLDPDGEAIVTTDLPDATEVPFVVQLGMVEMARQSVWHRAGDDEGDDE